MNGESVWLGKFEKPVWFAMLIFISITAITYLWLVFNQIFFDDAVGVHEMIRPEGRSQRLDHVDCNECCNFVCSNLFV